jgi:hypothetical protein
MRTPRIILNAFAAVLCLSALLAAGDLRAGKPTRTITGTVVSAEVYGGKVRSVYIKDSQEGDFLVVRGTEIGKELLKLVGVKVTATGYIRKTRRDPVFENVIDVLSYGLVPSDDIGQCDFSGS